MALQVLNMHCIIPPVVHNKHTEIHPHFYGEKYKETTCMSSFSTPKIKLTKPFEIHSTELIIKGVCNVYN